MRYLVTGAAGFIGSYVCGRLLDRGDEVVGLDNINDYYDPSLKDRRLERLNGRPGFSFVRLSVEDRPGVEKLFAGEKFDGVVHLAAQAGVRYSLTNPHAYIDSNIVGFINILEGCRHSRVGHLVYASSSSVYGLNETLPFSVSDTVDHPASLYAATKKANELMAHTYSHLYGIPTTGLRFFTVYGPWGRPDMALFMFTRNILEGRPIDVFNGGKHARDFTYVDDIVEGVIRVLDTVPSPDPSWSGRKPNPANSRAPYRIYNIGNNSPVELLHFIDIIEKEIGRKAIRNYLPLQPGDVEKTYADVISLSEVTGFKPATRIEDGIASFVRWYRDYYNC
jgi:UDP-glucuronate 4-epimerase